MGGFVKKSIMRPVMDVFKPDMPEPVVPQTPTAPTVAEIKQPEATINQEVVDRNVADIMRRRRGRTATISGAAEQGTTAGAVASKTLLGE